MDDRVRGRHSGKRRFVGVYNKLQQLFQFDNVYLLRSGDKIRIPGNRAPNQHPNHHPNPNQHSFFPLHTHSNYCDMMFEIKVMKIVINNCQ